MFQRSLPACRNVVRALTALGLACKLQTSHGMHDETNGRTSEPAVVRSAFSVSSVSLPAAGQRATHSYSRLRPSDPAAPGLPRLLCVDLDGTLVATDLLWESVVLLVKRHPRLLVLLPLWLMRGKAHLKQQLATYVRPNASTLPYRVDVLQYVDEARRSGRPVILATASDERLAEDVAAHLGCFSGVLASDGVTNLSGTRKRDALVARFGVSGFDYIGNSRADLSGWSAANAALLVDPSRSLLREAQCRAPVEHVFTRQRRWGSPLVAALRVYQWTKNALVFVPLVLAHQVLDLTRVRAAAVTFLVFSLIASAVYVANDLLDLESDRMHPRKRRRPFAAGDLSIPAGAVLCVGLALTAFVIAGDWLPARAVVCLAAYSVLATAYSLWLKRLVVTDVIVLAGLYVLRVIAGAVAVSVPLSHWLLGFSMFFFLSLALMKRHAELTALERSGRSEAAGRGYRSTDREWLGSMGTCGGYLSVLVLALYITNRDVEALYHWPAVLWPICPAVLYWIMRMWARVYRGLLDDDPLLASLRDPVSYALGALVAMLVFLAARL